MQRLCVHKSLERFPAIAFFAKALPAYEKLHGRPFCSVATMVQNLFDYEFLDVLLRHGNGIRAFGVIIKGPEIVDVCHHHFIVDEVLDSVNRAGVGHNLIRTPVSRN